MFIPSDYDPMAPDEETDAADATSRLASPVGRPANPVGRALSDSTKDADKEGVPFPRFPRNRSWLRRLGSRLAPCCVASNHEW
jgi:hypothetical protein